MRRDTHKAQSLLKAAQRNIEVAWMLEDEEVARETIVRNIYEAFRQLGDARLALAGIPHADHDTQIKELLRLDIISERPLESINHLKQLRHTVNYKGYQPTAGETRDAFALARALFEPCSDKVKEEIATT